MFLLPHPMRLPVFLLCLALLSPLSVLSQNSDDAKLQALQSQILILTKQDDLDGLIQLGEKIVDLEKRRGRSNRIAYSVALRNLATWKNKRIEAIRLSSNITSATLAKYNWEVRETAKIFEELAALAEDGADRRELAMAQSSLADYLQAHFPNSRGSEVEDLFRRSISLRERIEGSNSASTLIVVGKLARVYFARSDFESFVPLGRRLAAAAMLPSPSKSLLPYVKLYADFLTTVDRGSEAVQMATRISEIEGTSYIPSPSHSISTRSVSELNLNFGEKTPVVLRPQRGSENNLLIDRSLPRKHPLEVDIAVLIDEAGSLVNIEPVSAGAIDRELADEIRRRSAKWKFKPFLFDGKPTKMRGRIRVYYYKP